MFPLLRWTPYFISAKKTFIKNRLGKILDNLLRINVSVGGVVLSIPGQVPGIDSVVW